MLNQKKTPLNSPNKEYPNQEEEQTTQQSLKKSLKRRGFLKKAALATAGAASTTFAAPQIIAGEKKRRWKMVTTWPKNYPGLGIGANNLAKRITEMSNGRLTVKVYGAGEIVPAMGVFDAVSRGTAEMGHGAPFYWKGKNPTVSFFGAIPFGMMAQEMSAWLSYGGGQKLWDELYAQFGLKAFAAGNSGVQMGGWFNKEIKTVKDFKGLKMRIPGLGGDVLKQLGTTVVTLPGGELFQAMKSRTLDAAEWSGPYADLAFGMNKTAKFYYWPGWQEPSAVLEAMFNQKAYNELPKDLKAIVKVACQASNDDIIAEANARNGRALETIVQKHKIILKKFPDPVLKTLNQTSQKVVREVGNRNAFSKKVYNSYTQFQKYSGSYARIADEAYYRARRLTS